MQRDAEGARGARRIVLIRVKCIRFDWISREKSTADAVGGRPFHHGTSERCLLFFALWSVPVAALKKKLRPPLNATKRNAVKLGKNDDRGEASAVNGSHR